MSFKNDMAVAREYSKQYLQQPFDYALQKAVKWTFQFSFERTLKLCVLAEQSCRTVTGTRCIARDGGERNVA